MKLDAFPPFCVLPRVLQTTGKDGAQGVVEVPYQPSQPWFPRLGSLLTEKSVLVSARQNLLQMPTGPNMEHQLRKTLWSLICKVSETEDFHHKQLKWLASHGELEQSNCALFTSENGKCMHVKGSPAVTKAVNFLWTWSTAGQLHIKDYGWTWTGKTVHQGGFWAEAFPAKIVWNMGFEHGAQLSWNIDSSEKLDTWRVVT